MGGRTAVPPALALWTGLALARCPGQHAAVVPALLTAAAVLGALAWRSPPRTGALFVMIVAALVGGARGAAWNARFESALAALPADGTAMRGSFVLEEPARRESGEPVALARVLAARPAMAVGTRVRLRLPGTCTADWGDTIDVFARLERFPGVRNPGGFDAAQAAAAAGAVAHGRAWTATVRPARGLAALPAGPAMRVRRAVEAALAGGVSSAARELAAPLVFGDRGAMTPETDARLRGSGLVHLIALSGLHVVWLAAVVRGIVAVLRGGRVARAAGGAACAVAYALLAGPLPSLARACAGECIAAAARFSQRALDPLQSLALSVVALLAWRPGWADDLGFQLSCAATLGLVTLSEPLASPLASYPRARAAGLALSTTLAAQATALPLLLARFHAVPWTGLVANLVAVPVSELLLASAWLGGLLEALLPGMGGVFLRACDPLALALREIAARASSPPLALLSCGGNEVLPPLAAAGALLLALALPGPRAIDARAFGRPPAARRAALAGALLLGASLLASLLASPLTPPPGRWWLVAIDVGQGDALAIAGEGRWWLVDAGPRTARWDAGEGSVLPFLRWAGVRRLERLVVTHDDGDHTGGAFAVRRSLLVRETCAPAARPGVRGPGWRFGARELGRGDVLAGAPHALVLWPPYPGEAGESLARRGDNAAALVLELGAGAGRALLMADADSLVEAALDPVPGAALLKVGHHGSGSSTGAAFLQRVRPARALLSVGRRNAYGHPHAGTLARLERAGMAIDRTDTSGAQWYELSEDGVRLLDWRRGEWRWEPLAHAPAPAPDR
jgi:competence protein ComEC